MDDLIKYAKPIRADNNKPLESGVNYVAVTFDDAFQSVVINALPELIQRKIPFTIFVPTGYLGRHPKWTNNPIYKDRHEIVMTADQLRKLPSNYVSIGSHTVTHSILPLLKEVEAKKEICESRCELERILGYSIKLFSFPYGQYNQKLIKLARQAGYKRVFTILPSLAYSEPEEYVTGRITIDPTDWRLEFRLKLLGAYRWLPYAFTLKYRLRSVLIKILNHSRAPRECNRKELQ